MRNNSIRKHLRERFHITPKVGHDFAGVLLGADKEYYTFADVLVYPPDAEPQKLDGETWVHKADVAFLQRLPNANR